MPIYEYANEALGVEVQLRQAVDERRDSIVLTRRQIPSRVTVGVGVAAPTINDRLAAGYKQLESSGQMNGATGKDYLPTSEIKRAMAEPAC